MKRHKNSTMPQSRCSIIKRADYYVRFCGRHVSRIRDHPETFSKWIEIGKLSVLVLSWPTYVMYKYMIEIAYCKQNASVSLLHRQLDAHMFNLWANYVCRKTSTMQCWQRMEASFGFMDHWHEYDRLAKQWSYHCYTTPVEKCGGQRLYDAFKAIYL